MQAVPLNKGWYIFSIRTNGLPTKTCDGTGIECGISLLDVPRWHPLHCKGVKVCCLLPLGVVMHYVRSTLIVNAGSSRNKAENLWPLTYGSNSFCLIHASRKRGLWLINSVCLIHESRKRGLWFILVGVLVMLVMICLCICLRNAFFEIYLQRNSHTHKKNSNANCTLVRNSR